MKKAIKQLIQVRKEIKEVKKFIKHTSLSKYFIVFGTEEQRKEEILIHKSELKKLLKKEFTALENLQRQCEIAKAKNSQKSRTLNLETNEN